MANYVYNRYRQMVEENYRKYMAELQIDPDKSLREAWVEEGGNWGTTAEKTWTRGELQRGMENQITRMLRKQMTGCD